ncbi:site-specific DNA-methyltransferase [bacterium]|nr:MAG: site-specific DNA-methyltransferase [bacterium]
MANTLSIAYKTSRGHMLHGCIEDFLGSKEAAKHRGRVALIFTSPPFPLNRKKRYGNHQGDEYSRWLASLAPALISLLKPNGSIVIELGNAWEPGRPVMSLLAMESLLEFMRTSNLNLCQQFVCDNPARLPSPAQWVNVERIRVKDSFTHVWWMAPSDRPKADNRRILKAYSGSMRRLLRTKRYNAGVRPSQHNIGRKSFLRDNGGSIPANCLSFANTGSINPYLEYCREHQLEPHPARMPSGLAEFFIKFLTEPKDLVLDPFAGSNTTGAVAETLKRRWISIEPKSEYIASSLGRFDENAIEVIPNDQSRVPHVPVDGIHPGRSSRRR